ncbi:hypothetical protein MACK_000607 [Theileria orientalis]|uniref:Uncharacterized protein n=1 Tax=Theileria orientalis TaxID=68886 RepID=A0A976M9X6_THEOR|nr:hypothetical protein MACK_000607 [Theileria orientalis]
MGGRQSYLYIFLKNKKEEYGGDGYSVKRSVQLVPNCRNFEVVNHKITYKDGNGVNFDIYIYDTEEMVSKASYIFGYCSPGVESHVAKEVRAYYSILAPKIPIVISFVRGSGDTHNCYVPKLTDDRWNWAGYITEYSLGPDLATNLQKSFEKKFWNLTIGFEVGSTKTKDVLVFPRGIDKKNYRIIFIPLREDAFLNSNCLFNFNTKLKHRSELPEVQAGCEPSAKEDKNQIDSYFLDSVKGQFYNGIIVYYARENPKDKDKDKDDIDLEENHKANTAIIVEFIYLCTTTTLKRKTSNGSWWAEEKFSYNDDNDLQTQVNEIYKNVKDTTINTVILEKTSSYLGVSKLENQDVQVYVKYTHKFEAPNKTVLLFERKIPAKGPLKGLDNKVQRVDVYYLKAKDAKNEGKDPKPFLISLYEDDGSKLSKVCHFDNKDKLDEWVELKGDNGETLDKKLERKLEKIKTNGSCTFELRWLRTLVCHILTTEEAPHEKPPKPPGPEERPEVIQQVPPPIPPNWLLIIGSSVGAFLFLCLLAIGYGIYWYNTTIKLLT